MIGTAKTSAVGGSGTRLRLMTAAPQHPEHPDLHELVDQLSPAQADAVRAVVLQLVTPTSGQPEHPPVGRSLAFVGAGASEHGITPHLDELLADGFGRD